jgi:hypothetical protein
MLRVPRAPFTNSPASAPRHDSLMARVAARLSDKRALKLSGRFSTPGCWKTVCAGDKESIRISGVSGDGEAERQ